MPNRTKEPGDLSKETPRKILRLYVSGQTPRSITAIANLRSIVENELNDEFDIQIVDVLQNPVLAEREKILATPTLIKDLPPPIRRMIGDLSNTEKVLIGLDIMPAHDFDVDAHRDHLEHR